MRVLAVVLLISLAACGGHKPVKKQTVVVANMQQIQDWRLK